MAILSDLIENFIKELINETEGNVEIKRNELASKFNCVPSQINYVIGTRFTQERGYYVESRRGGGGHIRITRVEVDRPGDYLMHIVASMGDSISQQSAQIFIQNFIDYEIITPKIGELMKAATSDRALEAISPPIRDIVRASIMKNMLACIRVK
ncbi:MAG: CtsR family transcriptional regulator [Clostridia bacterium]|jgi:transcriptional regulator CtsR|nr:CtsR family transcriptional regulator [Clostridiaceae bacterium]